jgi:hypothetical protein
MLTDQQITATALRIIDGELRYLTDYEMNGLIGDQLCADHCTATCFHGTPEGSEEMQKVRDTITAATVAMRAELARYATARGVTLPAPDARP